MPGQIIAASLMFFITIFITAMFWWPALKVKHKSALVGFYWMGFWAFLGGLASMSGAQAVLKILGQNVERFGAALLFGLTSAFVCFVVFAWVRLTFKGLGKSIGALSKPR